MLVLNAGFLTALSMLGRIDQVTVAAHGLGLRVQSLAFVPGLGIGQATAAMIGQALGAGDADRARSIARASMGLCLGFMTAIAILLLFAAHPLVHIFDVAPGSALERESVERMYILALAMPPAAINIAMIGLLQGSGATRTSLRINIWSRSRSRSRWRSSSGSGSGSRRRASGSAFRSPSSRSRRSTTSPIARAVTGVRLEKAL
jgi:Na+-driven multidrug efflux pump